MKQPTDTLTRVNKGCQRTYFWRCDRRIAVCFAGLFCSYDQPVSNLNRIFTRQRRRTFSATHRRRQSRDHPIGPTSRLVWTDNLRGLCPSFGCRKYYRSCDRCSWLAVPNSYDEVVRTASVEVRSDYSAVCFVDHRLSSFINGATN